jgi:hypothetical protein
MAQPNKSFGTTAIIAGLAAALAVAVTLLVVRGKSNEPGSSAPGAATSSASLTSNGAQQGQSTGVFINEKEIAQSQVDELKQTYGAAPPAGHYWYDSRSGLYGYWGREAAGYIRPGHNFGELSPRASNGNTGVFLNGREINMTEAGFFQRLFGVVYQGHFWLDGSNGNMGVEGNPTPLANLVVAMQRAQASGGGSSEYHWRDGSGAVVGGEGNCTFAAIPGAPVYSTPGCG